MTLEEVYNHYGQCWALTCRELGVSRNTYQNWVKKGFIPIETQVRIEHTTKGLFKANLNHSRSNDGQGNCEANGASDAHA